MYAYIYIYIILLKNPSLRNVVRYITHTHTSTNTDGIGVRFSKSMSGRQQSKIQNCWHVVLCYKRENLHRVSTTHPSYTGRYYLRTQLN